MTLANCSAPNKQKQECRRRSALNLGMDASGTLRWDEVLSRKEGDIVKNILLGDRIEKIGESLLVH